MKRITALLMVAVAIVVFCSGIGDAALISVDFGNRGLSGGIMSGAAVIGSDGDKWNVTDELGSGTMPLVDVNDQPTGITMVWDAPDGPSGVTTNTWNALMEDYLLVQKTNPQDITVTLSGLHGVYDLYLYGGTVESSTVELPKTIKLTVDVGPSEVGSVTLASTSLEYDYVEGANYGVLRNVSVAAGQTLTITGVNMRGDQTAAFNGFQLIPEPTSALLLLTGALGLLVWPRRRRK
ncbi:MAG: PEP-CTERM sorting domain-containing protein [Thermoguttaceae bacterium]|jgi:hypothetical protein|nr:PEP-CTERM sorting domain-containing protein [Thermoguttaceae bacterium]